MAKVTLDTYQRSVNLAEAAESLRLRLMRFRDVVTEVRILTQECANLDILTRSRKRVAEAGLALSVARLADHREDLDAAIENFSAMWQELRAELDMAHVLAVTPE